MLCKEDSRKPINKENFSRHMLRYHPQRCQELNREDKRGANYIFGTDYIWHEPVTALKEASHNICEDLTSEEDNEEPKKRNSQRSD
jgi:hypothetical protein